MKIIGTAKTDGIGVHSELEMTAEDTSLGGLRSDAARHTATANFCYQMVREMFDKASEANVKIRSFLFVIQE